MTITNWADVLQWAGCASGLAGAFTIALGPRRGGYGFALFLTSNFLWIAYATIVWAPGLLVMSLGYLATSLLGLYQWVVKPVLDARAMNVDPRLLRYRRAAGAAKRRQRGTA